MSAVKVLRCPIRHQFAPIKTGTKTDSIWHSGVLVVQKTQERRDSRTQILSTSL